LVDPLNGVPMTPEQKKSNVRLGLTLASVALAILVGFFAKMVLLGH